MRDVLVRLNAETGQKQWEVNFVEELKSKLPAFGFVCWPLVDKDAIYVQAGASVVKLDKKSGKVIWRALKDGGGMSGSAFSSPIITKVAGRRQLVVQTRQDLAGLALDKGDVLWKQTAPSFRGMNILTPVVVGNAVFTSSYRNRFWLYQVTQDNGQFRVETAWSNNAQG
jgi:outer membrane protein assembly factor BamB